MGFALIRSPLTAGQATATDAAIAPAAGAVPAIRLTAFATADTAICGMNRQAPNVTAPKIALSGTEMLHEQRIGDTKLIDVALALGALLALVLGVQGLRTD